MQPTTTTTTTPSLASRRAQPPRHSRTTTSSRKTATPQSYGRGLPSPDSAFTSQLSSINKFYPGLAAFTDAIDALPRETIRHFTLLREVDAKACGPEQQLRDYVELARSTQPPDDPAGYDQALEQLLVMERLKRCQDDMNALNQTRPELLQMNENLVPPSRRSRMQQIRWVISDLLLTLDEKIHVISTAADALNKQLARLDDAYSAASKEVDVITKDGNPDHWAYETPVPTKAAAQPLPHHQPQQPFPVPFPHQAHQHHGHVHQHHVQRQAQHQAYRDALANESGGPSRAESKKESAKRNAAPAYAGKPHDDDDGTGPIPASGSTKKSGHGSKHKKDADAHSAAAAHHGIHGIHGTSKSPSLAASSAPGSGAPSSKRRKIAEKANNHVSNGNAAGGAATPRERSPSALSISVPVTATSKKKSSGQSSESRNKRKTLNAMSPKAATPSHKASDDPAAPGQTPSQKVPNPPVSSHGAPPSASSKPSAARSKQSKTQSSSKDEAKAPRLEQNILRAAESSAAAVESGGHEHTSAKESLQPAESAEAGAGSPTRPTATKKSVPREDRPAKAAAPVDAPVAKVEEKPPVEAPAPVPATSSKAPAVSKAEPVKVEEEEDEDEIEGDEADEMRYCYCNQVSYGKMVACDGPDCKREWFHLPCVGLSHMPGPKEKWYCNDCRTTTTTTTTTSKHSRSHSRY